LGGKPIQLYKSCPDPSDSSACESILAAATFYDFSTLSLTDGTYTNVFSVDLDTANGGAGNVFSANSLAINPLGELDAFFRNPEPTHWFP
jgi:hypothetical protein